MLSLKDITQKTHNDSTVLAPPDPGACVVTELVYKSFGFNFLLRNAVSSRSWFIKVLGSTFCCDFLFETLCRHGTGL